MYWRKILKILPIVYASLASLVGLFYVLAKLLSHGEERFKIFVTLFEIFFEGIPRLFFFPSVILSIVPRLRPVKQWLDKYSDVFSLDHQNGTRHHERQLKKRLIEKMRSFYERDIQAKKNNIRAITGQEAIDLKYCRYPDVAEMKRGRGRISSRMVSEKNPVREIYAAAITGEAGSGKSYSFTKKAYELLIAIDLKSAEEIDDARIPYVVELGPWDRNIISADNNRLEIWLAERLRKQYAIIDEKEIRWLIEQDNILPCLDGLDEVEQPFRADCLEAIAEYIKTDKSLLFSCRKKEMIELDEITPIDLPVYEVLPLAKPLILNAITGFHNRSAIPRMRDFLKHNPAFFENITSPLLLNLFLGTYDSLTRDEKGKIEAYTPEECLKLLWEKYDLVVFAPLKITDYKKRLMRTYAAWIARQIKDSSFYIEDMQPAWLAYDNSPKNIKFSKLKIGTYYLVSRTWCTLMVSIAVGCIIASPFDFIGDGILAGILLTMLTMGFNDRLAWLRWLTKFPVLVFTIVLVLFCGAYQGFSIPRAKEDMIGAFSITESCSGIILGIIVGIVFGLRKQWQTPETDIQPVEKFTFNWKQSVKTGLKGGVIIGLVIAIFGWVLERFFNAATFNSWLDPYSLGLVHRLPFTLGPGRNAESLGVIFLAFFVAFFMGFFLVALMAGREAESIVEARMKRKKLNSGMLKSVFHSLSHGLLTFVVICLLFSLLLSYANPAHEVSSRQFFAGIGLGMISFLWFGGLDVIQHIVLRVLLFLSGMAPLFFSVWLNYMHKIGFLRQSGASLQFEHISLRNYLATLPVVENKVAPDPRMIYHFRPAYSTTMGVLFSLLSCWLLVLPFADRYWLGKYWTRKDEINYINDKGYLVKVEANMFRMTNSGILHIWVSGTVNVGTFLGEVGPEGTTAGFMCFPVSDAYNCIPKFRHGALLYRVNGREWKYVITPPSSFWDHIEPQTVIRLNKNDHIEFLVNDTEWQNNAGHFLLKFEWFNQANPPPNENKQINP